MTAGNTSGAAPCTAGKKYKDVDFTMDRALHKPGDTSQVLDVLCKRADVVLTHKRALDPVRRVLVVELLHSTDENPLYIVDPLGTPPSLSPSLYVHAHTHTLHSHSLFRLSQART